MSNREFGAPEPALGVQCTYISHLPPGCIAADSNGRAVVVWPDGRYARPGGPKIPPDIDSTSFGPYEIRLMNLDDAACDAWDSRHAPPLPQPEPAPEPAPEAEGDAVAPEDPPVEPADLEPPASEDA